MKTTLAVLAACLLMTAAVQSQAAPPKQKKKVLVQCLSGSQDPTRATLCLVAAFGIAEAGHSPMLVLSGEAAYLLDDTVAKSTVGVGLGNASDWFKKVKKHQVPIFV